jgi:hypothetical protein
MKKALPLILVLPLLFSACAAQTKVSLKWEKAGEKKEYRFTCDNKEALAACFLAEKLVKDPHALKGKDLSLSGCPQGKTGNEEIRLKGRIVKKDVDASFFPGETSCQRLRWQKVLPLLQEVKD